MGLLIFNHRYLVNITPKIYSVYPEGCFVLNVCVDFFFFYSVPQSLLKMFNSCNL